MDFDSGAVDKREPAGLARWIEDLHDLAQRCGRHASTGLHAKRVANSAEVFEVGAGGIGGPHADPGEVRDEVVPRFGCATQIFLYRYCLYLDQWPCSIT